MERKGFIGGSDCVKIMEGEWEELWEVKTGLKEPESLLRNLPVQLGIHTENFNLKWFAMHEAKEVVAQQKEYIASLNNIPVKGTIDGAIKDENNIIEAKHTNNFYNMDKVLTKYMPQIQLYCHIAKADGAYLSVIFGNSKWECLHIAYNQDYLNQMWELVTQFWTHVQDKKRPVDREVEAVSTENIVLDQMVVRDASRDNEFVSEAHAFISTLNAAQVNDRAKKNLKNMVGHNEREVFCDTVRLKRDKRGAIRITRRTAHNDKI